MEQEIGRLLPLEEGENRTLGRRAPPPAAEGSPAAALLSLGSTATSRLWLEQHQKPPAWPWALAAHLPYLGVPAGEEEVGQLCHQHPQRDLESAGLPEAPTGQQLEVLEIGWTLLRPTGLASSWLSGRLSGRPRLCHQLSGAPVLLSTWALSLPPQPQQRPGGAKEKARPALGPGSCEGWGTCWELGVLGPSPTQDLCPLQDRAR